MATKTRIAISFVGRDAFWEVSVVGVRLALFASQGRRGDVDSGATGGYVVAILGGMSSLKANADLSSDSILDLADVRWEWKNGQLELADVAPADAAGTISRALIEAAQRHIQATLVWLDE